MLLAADPDLFNRWEAGQDLARDLILARAAGAPDEVGEERYAEAVAAPWPTSPPTRRSRPCCWPCPPSPTWPWPWSPADPAAIHEAREALRARLAVHLRRRRCSGCTAACRRPASSRPTPPAPAAGRCATPRWTCWPPTRTPTTVERALRPLPRRRQHDRRHGRAGRPDADRRRGVRRRRWRTSTTRWKDEPLVIDKWFAVQAREPGRGRARPGAGPDRPPGLRRQEPQPAARPGRRPSPAATRRASTTRPAPATASWPTRSWPSTASTR